MFTAIDNYQVGKEKESRAIDVYGKPGSLITIMFYGRNNEKIYLFRYGNS